MHTNEQPRQSGDKQELINASHLFGLPMGSLIHLFGELFIFLAAKQYKVRRPPIYAVTKAKERGKCSQLFGSFVFTRTNLPGYFLTIRKDSLSWRTRAREVAWTQSGIRAERRGTRRHKEAKGVEDTLRGRCWPVCNQTGGSEAVGTHYVLHTHISTTFFFFAPFLPTMQKKWTNSTLLGFSLLHSNNTNRCIADLPTGLGLRVEVPPGSSSGVFGKVRWHRARSQGRASLQRPRTEDLIKFILAIIQSGLQR